MVGKMTGRNFSMTEAVSPVVGVMLMLVVTIVIAAVVSGFATGIMSDKTADLPGKISFHGIHRLQDRHQERVRRELRER